MLAKNHRGQTHMSNGESPTTQPFLSSFSLFPEFFMSFSFEGVQKLQHRAMNCSLRHSACVSSNTLIFAMDYYLPILSPASTHLFSSLIDYPETPCVAIQAGSIDCPSNRVRSLRRCSNISSAPYQPPLNKMPLPLSPNSRCRLWVEVSRIRRSLVLAFVDEQWQAFCGKIWRSVCITW